MAIYFYKANQAYGCFSNFSPHRVYLQGHSWATSEHFYQAQKFVNSPDEVLVSAIRQAATPEEAAAIGRNPRHQIRPDWDQVKQEVMYDAVKDKFQRHRSIRDILLGTNDERLIEDSPVDYYWGCGAKGNGHNHLGRILMAVRGELRQRSAPILTFATPLPLALD
ncbi:MAG: NADAR family protein [Cyanobacteria bacterium P01_C01_bin.89]